MPDISTIADLKDRLDDERVAMLSTADERGTISSRPVTIQDIADDGDVWFLVDGGAEWVHPADGSAINASVTGDGVWASFAGRAVVDSSSDKVDELMDEMSKTWFGPESNPVALRIVTDQIEWWASPNKAAQLFELAKAKVTDSKPDIGSSGTIDT